MCIITSLLLSSCSVANNRYDPEDTMKLVGGSYTLIGEYNIPFTNELKTSKYEIVLETNQSSGGFSISLIDLASKEKLDIPQSYFSDDLTIESVVTAPHELAGLKCDMILSTLPLTAEPPVVLISNFISSNDRQAISDVIHRLKAAREKERLISLLQTLIDADLFTPGADYADRESAIRTIGGQMCARGIVPQEFIESTLEREQISPTNFGMIAIPHPSDCRAARSAIAVSLLRKPLSWGTSSVRIIFMICVSKSDLSDFSDIFSYLPRVCSDYKTLEQLASASSYPDFIQILGGLCAE